MISDRLIQFQQVIEFKQLNLKHISVLHLIFHRVSVVL